ncbi:poly [ADP-ribose] polymerase-like [Diabrotica undecimpunctata]|uniref:poly [ADP-ribose] polymerase-like n=1 Tax=Diabrotica undecimpunctata TaxID=50387 RepID=UPI003B6399CA
MSYWNWYDSDNDDYMSDTYNWSYRGHPFKQHQSTSAAFASRKYPYLAEYSTTSVTCRGCWNTIPKGALRLGVSVQDLKDDNKVQYWYDFGCFFKKQRPKNTVDIYNFESLKISDQNKIKKRVESSSFHILPDTILTGKKRGAGIAIKQKQKALKDFKIEYAKSGRAMCRGCLHKILKNEIRISKKNYDTEVGKKFDGQDMWHHVTCFVALREDLGYFEAADKLPGFKVLKPEDQDLVLKELYAVNPDDPEIKKVKIESTTSNTSQNELNKDDKKLYKAQNKIMFDYRDKLSKLTAKDLKSLLEVNKQVVPEDKVAMLDRLADAMTFGALLPCIKCKGQLVFENGGYMCSGRLSEWAKCDASEKEPARQQFTVPAALLTKKLADYIYEPRTRIIISELPSTSDKNETNYFKPRVNKEPPALYDMLFVIVGKPPKGKDEIKKQILSMGGKLITKIDEKVAAIISTTQEVEKMNMRMQQAEKFDIHVVPDDFLDEAKNNVGKIADLIIEKSICEWGSDPTDRLPKKDTVQYKSIYSKSGPAKVTIKLKGGSAVDPESNLVDRAHVYEEGDTKYTVVLGLTDIQLGKNSYHKLQLLEQDSLHSYWVFQAWGRIGTNIGDRQTLPFYTLDLAKNFFVEQYKKKTGNDWDNRHNFKKQPNMMYPIDVDFAEDLKKYEISETPSVLPTSVQDLLKMIFDINAMQKLMLEFELDTQKMPLGKLSKAQMEKAFGVLSELQTLVSAKADRALFIDASNRFFTFIPHSFGLGTPPVMDNEDIIKKKVEMLNSLLELEIAYNLMQTANKGVDDYYKGLNTEIGILDKNSREFRIIQDYVKFTHTVTHNQYKLIVEEVYTIKRQGEEERFNKFSQMHNHKLLWHGSRVTNFAGILSQGLRIAPAEAPNSGAMFGKGIYFADMVSKSANYCFANRLNPIGLALLCDVALGNMYDRLDADNIRKLPEGMNSCRGLGRTHPDPNYVQKIGNIVVPTGKGVHQLAAATSSLLYNEYIVYDVAQVNIKYLVKMRFDFKHPVY